MSLPSGEIPLDITCPPPLLPVQSYHTKYRSISNIGNGSFGTVELAKYRLDKEELLKASIDKRGTLLDPLVDSRLNLTGLVAIKTMKKRLPSLYDYTRVKEVRFILSISSHSCLVQVYEMFIDDVKFQLHISMESLNQNLYQLMKARKSVHFSPVTLRSILSQVLCAIGHIHSHNYFHRDVKPENILVIPTRQYYGSKEAIPPYRKNDNFVVKLADYGLARHIHNLKPYTAYVSTRWYRSPEILLRQKWYSKPIDIWAFGSVAAEVANFAPLFPGSNELDQIWRILRVMGSPVLRDNVTQPFDSISLGGYWKDAHILAGKLGFIFPPERGLSLQDILPNPLHADLGEVIKICLCWDPNIRPSVETLSSMSYFKNTIVSMRNKEPERDGNTLVKPEDLTRNSRKVNYNLQPFEANKNILQPMEVLNFNQEADKSHQAYLRYKENEESSTEESLFNQFNLDIMPLELGSTETQNFDESNEDEEGEDSEEFDEDDNERNDENDSKLDVHFREYLENSKSNHEFEYSWNLNKQKQFPESIPEELEQDYDILADVSFGSGKEINVV